MTVSKQPQGMEMLAMKIREGDGKAAREYIRAFRYGCVCDRDVMLSALAFAIHDMIGEDGE